MFFGYVDGRAHSWTRNEENRVTGQNKTKISVHGSLDVKVPITADCMDDMVYIQYSHEQHVAMAKFENPDFKKKIKGGAIGAGQDVYERTARISVTAGNILHVEQWRYADEPFDRPADFWMRRVHAFEMLEDDAKRCRRS